MKSNFFNRLFVRNLEAGNLLENFLVASISSFLLIRFFLKVLNYPQLGNGQLHIAHMLWGGLLMFLALIICFSFLTKLARNLSSIIGGIGFGTFIDELGKFLTKDSNYFFQPTVALIYVIFILIFLLYREMEKYNKASENEYLINALEVSKEAFVSDLSEEEKEKALGYIKKYSLHNDFTKSFKLMIEKTQLVIEKKPNIFSKIIRNSKKYYRQIIQNKWFIKIIILVFLFQSILLLQHIWEVINSLPYLFPPAIPFYKTFELFFSIISELLALLGIIIVRKNRLSGYKIFKKSTLVSIFLTQFFAFYTFQLYALKNLAVNLLILLTLDFLIERESAIRINNS